MHIATTLLQQVIDNSMVTLVQVLMWALGGLFFITCIIGGLLVKIVKDYLNDNKELHKDHEKSFATVNTLLTKHDVKIEYHEIELGNLKDKVYTVKYPKE